MTSGAAQLSLRLEPTDEVGSAVSEWLTAATAPRERAIQVGRWIAGERRWAWLFHTAWDDRKTPAGFYCDGEEIVPTHWRDINEPDFCDGETTKETK